ncbi:MAG: hypothetical protein DWQ34_28460 [Planctomycetota bacterium]|nr:MAG: hypothetical protein DWQ34_28460 [Planctomycetota bacterium]REJ90581.1 MAG: hypothetical protein DWQ29_06470 [Planctomycetota bacterium]REK21431.1 MAG: hypothetical protein DWQ41_21610 [Planctomycetota bacterium]REK40057.1 MAG: hypothetical protein DWQ45_00435 [Planctomycetota bacterium]
MADLTRREFAQRTLGSLLTYSLLETLFSADAFPAEVKPVAAAWLARVDAAGRDLKGEKLSQTEWQSQIEELFGQIELAELLKFIDFDQLTAELEFREQGERSLKPKFPEVEGLPTDLVFGHQLFALRKGRSVVPHGHDNMATAFLILQGDFHGRHYDRLEDDGDSIIIRPTIDESFTVGGCSTVSDHKDNVHWFKATSETAFIFNIHVLNVVEGRKTGRVYIDPDGEPLAGDRVRARRLKAAEAYKLYG